MCRRIGLGDRVPHLDRLFYFFRKSSTRSFYLMNFSQIPLRGAEIWHIWKQHHVIECFWKIMKSIFHMRSMQLQGDGLYTALLIKVLAYLLALRLQAAGVFSKLTITEIMRKLRREEDVREFLAMHFHAPFSISWVRFLEACFGFCIGVMVAGMSDYRHKRHNVSSLIYHIVCPAKYRRVIFDAEVDTGLKDVCLDIAQRYEIAFLAIGTDKDHVHFLVQSVPSYSPTKIVKIIKSLTAREILHRVPTVNKRLWGGEFWSKGDFISTVGRHGNEAVIREYVRQQGSDQGYTQLHRQDVQLGLF
jgi:putative transposase